MRCNYCGAHNIDTASFCSSCGNSLNNSNNRNQNYRVRKMNVFEILKTSFLNKFMQFNGRANRKEWWVYAIPIFLLNTLLAEISSEPVQAMFLPLVIPFIALSVRRLHDVNKSGLWLLAGPVPIFNVYLFYLLGIKESVPYYNQYGEVPQNTTYEERR